MLSSKVVRSGKHLGMNTGICSNPLPVLQSNPIEMWLSVVLTSTVGVSAGHATMPYNMALVRKRGGVVLQ